MRLIDIINAPWAITPDMLEEIQAIYCRHLRGEKIDLQGLEARIGQPLNNEHQEYEVIDGVAVLPVDGVIAQRANLFTKISGGTSSQMLIRDFHNALEDRSVEAIVTAYNSPGGTVAGTPEAAAAFFEARGVKPMISFTDGQMASAAYWMGAAADLVQISSDVTQVGSIGVLGKHIDMSAVEEREGRKTTLIYAGRYKTAGSPHQPLSEEDRAVLQSSVDHVYSAFVEDVARFRGASVEEVLTRMADGRTFDGRKAIDAGLVDGVSTMAETIEMARDMARTSKKTSRTGVVLAPTRATEKKMDIETLRAEHPELYQQVFALGQEGMVTADALQQQVATARDEGAESERQRIADVRAQAIPGHEDLIEQMAFDGKSTGADAAKAIVSAEKGLRVQAGQNHDEEAPPAVPSADSGGGSEKKTMKRTDFDALGAADQQAFARAGGQIVD